MKERFAKPTLEVVTFDAEDVIVTSGCSGNCLVVCAGICHDVCDHDCQDVT